MEQIIYSVLLIVSVTTALQVYGEYEDEGLKKWSEDGKGLSVLQEAKGYKVADDERSKAHQASGYFSGVQNDHNHFADGEKQYKDHYYGHEGKTEEAAKKKSGHYKQHTTKGFQNYHHKDEVGKTTTYIDSSDNSGDQFGYHGYGGAYGDTEHGGVHKNYHDGGLTGFTRENKGHYGSEANLGEKEGKKNMYEKKGYKDYVAGVADYLYAKKKEEEEKVPLFFAKEYPEKKEDTGPVLFTEEYVEKKEDDIPVFFKTEFPEKNEEKVPIFFSKKEFPDKKEMKVPVFYTKEYHGHPPIFHPHPHPHHHPYFFY